jgi:hypothetical protein
MADTLNETNSSKTNAVLSDEQLSELLRPGKEFENSLHALVNTLPMGTTNLLIVRLKDYASAPHALLTYFSQKKMPGVYVSVNKPYADIVKTLAQPAPNTQFVDAITSLTGRGTEDNQVVTFIDSPLALVELNLAISDRLKNMVSNQKFLILDSVSTLLVYNSSQSVEKFCHTVIAKNRNENVVGLFLMIESEDHRAVVETLAQFVDNVITVK